MNAEQLQHAVSLLGYLQFASTSRTLNEEEILLRNSCSRALSKHYDRVANILESELTNDSRDTEKLGDNARKVA